MGFVAFPFLFRCPTPLLSPLFSLLSFIPYFALPYCPFTILFLGVPSLCVDLQSYRVRMVCTADSATATHCLSHYTELVARPVPLSTDKFLYSTYFTHPHITNSRKITAWRTRTITEALVESIFLAFSSMHKKRAVLVLINQDKHFLRLIDTSFTKRFLIWKKSKIRILKHWFRCILVQFCILKICQLQFNNWLPKSPTK